MMCSMVTKWQSDWALPQTRTALQTRQHALNLQSMFSICSKPFSPSIQPNMAFSSWKLLAAWIARFTIASSSQLQAGLGAGVRLDGGGKLPVAGRKF